MAPIARASWLRGVSSLPNSFAHESYIDELATAAGVDPIAYRLRHLDDPRARDLVAAVAERAGWVPHTAPFSHGRDGTRLFGRGFAYAVYVHGTFPGTAAAWSAWVADVAVDTANRRGRGQPRRGGPGHRDDDQPHRGHAPDPRQRHPIDEPRPEGAGDVRFRRRGEP